MWELITVVGNAARCYDQSAVGAITGKMPNSPSEAKRRRKDPIIDACREVGQADIDQMGPNRIQANFNYMLTEATRAQKEGDMFTLRWFTFVVMYVCEEIVCDLSAASPKCVVGSFLKPFHNKMTLGTFGTRQKMATGANLDYTIETPLELVTSLMIELKRSYFQRPEE